MFTAVGHVGHAQVVMGLGEGRIEKDDTLAKADAAGVVVAQRDVPQRGVDLRHQLRRFDPPLRLLGLLGIGIVFHICRDFDFGCRQRATDLDRKLSQLRKREGDSRRWQHLAIPTDSQFQFHRRLAERQLRVRLFAILDAYHTVGGLGEHRRVRPNQPRSAEGRFLLQSPRVPAAQNTVSTLLQPRFGNAPKRCLQVTGAIVRTPIGHMQHRRCGAIDPGPAA